MLTLSSIFQEANNQSEKDRDVLVLIEDETIEGVKTSEADWTANLGELDVDYATVPGSVVLKNHELYSDWAEQTSLGQDRRAHSAVEISGIMYVFGGRYGSTYQNTLRAYDIVGDSWSSLASGATTRRGHSAIVYSGDMYIFGGSTNIADYNDFWKYDVSLNSWSQLFPTGGPPAARSFHHSTLVGSKLYIHGGYLAGGTSGTIDGTLWVLDLGTLVWTQLTSSDYTVAGGVMHHYNGELFQFGGSVSGGALSDTVIKYNISGDSWSAVTEGGPSPRRYMASAPISNRFFIFSGDISGPDDNEFWEFDMSTGLWAQKDSGASNRWWSTGIHYNNTFIMFGGMYATTPSYFDDVWTVHIGYEETGYIKTNGIDVGVTPTEPGEWQFHDIVPPGCTLIYEAWSNTANEFNQWVEEATTGTKPAERRGHTAIEYSGKAYLFGGEDGSTFYNDVWELNLSTFAWALKSTTGGPPTARAGHTAVLDSGKMYIFGGEDASNLNNEVWELNLSTFVWTQKTSGGTATSYHAAVNYAGKMYVNGGALLAGVEFPIKNTWEYNISGDSWTAKADSTISVMRHSYALSGDKMLTFGGTTGSVGIKSTYEYDITGNTWSSKADRPSTDGFKSGTAILYSGDVYVFGGYRTGPTSVGTKEFWRYNVSGNSWTQSNDGIVPLFMLASVLSGTDMVIIGGMNQGANYNDVYSADLTYTTAAAYLGVVEDGDPITDLKRYFSVEATLSANVGLGWSPEVQEISADFTTYQRFNRIPDLGYEPLVEDVSSLTSKVDFFKPASIGQISVSISMTDAVSDWVYSDTLYNKIVQVKLGFKYPGFVEADYIHYFTGAIDDWNVDDQILNLTLKDLSKDWKLPVPSKWESVADDVTWTAQHHTDIMLNIFQNYINVRDSGLLLDSFATIKVATPAYVVTRTITGKTEDAKKLVEELRVLLFAFFLPRGDGKIGIKQFDSTEAAAVTFTDDNTMGIKWQANSKDLINRTNLYFDWDTLGDKEENFDSYDGGDDTTSQTEFQEIRPYILKDKWTLDNMPATVTITCDAKDIAYEAGDMANVTTLEAPGSGGAGITDEKYLITSKNLDFLGDRIIFKGLKVA
jgi:hypothetical protein